MDHEPTNDLSVGYLMNWGGRLLRRLADRHLKPLGLTAAYLPVLNALATHEALAQKALARIAAIEQPTMAATLARMERDGIIVRQPDPHDGRSALFSLSPATRRKLPALRRAIAMVNEEALAGLPASERGRFHRQLHAVVAALEERLRSEAEES